MNLSDFPEVHRLYQERRSLEEQRRLVATSDAVGVTIQGRYQDSEVIDAVRPVVLAVLDKRVKAIDQQLVALRVEIGGR